jgi:cephalosporin hydroxylase
VGDVDGSLVSSTLEEQLHQPLLDYYHKRLFLHMDEMYAGIRMRKFPEDLRVYEELLWECRIDVVLELGLGHGGSALWFRDRLRTLAMYGRSRHGLVIAVDRDTAAGRHHLEIADPAFEAEIRLVQSDVRDPAVVSKVERHLPADARVLVIDDSAHRYDTTMATLRFFSPIVPVGGFIVIEDGHRDFPEMMPPNFPGVAQGVTTAIDEWLATEEGARFVLRRDKERYIVTSSPRGFLQRVG